MAARDRVNVFPSRTNLVHMKVHMIGAQKGFNLLKRKRDVMELKRRELEDNFRKKKDLADEAVKRAIFSLARLNFLDADIRPYGILKPNKADVFVRVNYQKTIGLLLPVFEVIQRNSDCFSLAGVARGGTEVYNVRLAFQEALRYIADVASIEYSIKILEKGIHDNSTRLNGLEYVLIPRYQNTISYISTELDEFEREEFFRLKRTQAKKTAQTKQEIDFMRAKRDDEEKYKEILEEKQRVRRRTVISRDFKKEERASLVIPNVPSYSGALDRLLKSFEYKEDGDSDDENDENDNNNASSNQNNTGNTEPKTQLTPKISQDLADEESVHDADNWDDFNVRDSNDSINRNPDGSNPNNNRPN